MIDLLLIHANWCGHCKALTPEWNKMKHMLSNNKNVSVHEVESGDANKEQRLHEFSKKRKTQEKISIRGFPMILRFENGEMTEYKGMRTAKELAKWAIKHKLSGGRKKKTKNTVKRKKNKTIKKITKTYSKNKK